MRVFNFSAFYHLNLDQIGLGKTSWVLKKNTSSRSLLPGWGRILKKIDLEMKTSLYLDRTRNMFDSIIILPVFNITCLVVGKPIIIALEIQTGSIFCLASYHSISTFYLFTTGRVLFSQTKCLNIFHKNVSQKFWKFPTEKNFKAEGF